MAVYAIGDIQGCYKPLKKLLKKVAFDPARDQLWCVGDLVNRGPDSLKVLRYLKSLGDACVCVLGNHDLHLLKQVAGAKRSSSRDTFDDVLQAPDRHELIEWLRHRPLLHHDEQLNWCMVHAGLHPSWSLKKARRRARKIEKRLRGDGWVKFCRKLAEADFPATEPLKGKPGRVAFALAVFTYTRYCTRTGSFNWATASGRPDSSRQRPWFTHKRLAWRDQCRVVYGHWAAKGLESNQPHVLGLDSGCVWGGRLTLARLDCTNPEISSVKCKGYQLIG
ncbi:MAG: symmetrical bis(5'-nucleosyl)-tetraphosphatase [Mariprofundaceae bacterium]|nr:symmetrical bis(5'-nucleosyl)-tetraphosphatase [Mariprofundaceae bacterium]